MVEQYSVASDKTVVGLQQHHLYQHYRILEDASYPWAPVEGTWRQYYGAVGALDHYHYDAEPELGMAPSGKVASVEELFVAEALSGTSAVGHLDYCSVWS